MIRNLVVNCAPTLAGIKTANMFSYRFASKEVLVRDVHSVNMKLNPKGIFAVILCAEKNYAQILVYRLSWLAADLAQDGTQAFLVTYGYHAVSVSDCISHLKKRFLSSEFPHEIGLFLGYPLYDVIEFIKNGGKNSKRTGCWKVYHDENEAKKKFAMYQYYKNVYLYCFLQGKPIEHLIA